MIITEFKFVIDQRSKGLKTKLFTFNHGIHGGHGKEFTDMTP